MKKIIIIITICICTINSIIINSIIETYNDFKLSNIFYWDESNVVEFKAEDNYNKEVLSIISKYEHISIQKDNLSINSYKGKAIYFNNYDYDIPMVEGNFFNQDDFSGNKNKIVIGKKLLDLVILRENKKYVKFNGVEYEVIGIIGYQNRESILDKNFYINLDGYLNQKNNNIREKLIISGYNKDKTLLINDININFKEVNIYENNNSFSQYLIKNKFSFLLKMVLVVVSLVISLLITTLQYINSKALEIRVRRLYGSSVIKIYIKFILEYIKILIIGVVVSLFLNIYIIKFEILKNILNNKIYMMAFGVNLIMIIIIGVIISYIYIRKINKTIHISM